ncbi:MULTISPECIES: hypothetical protein [Methylomonas]|uniref:Uncharacterized protein n=2 Tax=Methylomonas TaxID=416 RepID=A0A126T7W5_9GAMM|nr:MULTISPECIES: hypothetical protein [Methylomonas]AMK78162.1 hypothetical protein JT25_017010 [Methylomonas denitrificans]OAI03885.1 hypothetical protein A1342_04945 [Methylomonas methanica]TCV87810.1 hypothetical protein EDE11_102315 [Methylomonas methanica]
MITKQNLPSAYQPYQQLTLCSNHLIGGGYLIQIGGSLPLLIGKGAIPQVWLQAPTDPSGKVFAPLVSASVAAHPAVSVSTDDGALLVYAGGQLVLRVRQTNDQEAEVEALDLRPIGFNIYGDRKSLSAGGMHMSDNTVAGGGTFLAFGGG